MSFDWSTFCSARFWIYYFQVIVQEEYQIYQFESFVADVGGYLGLLLGASILSLVESSTNIIARFLFKRTWCPRIFLIVPTHINVNQCEINTFSKIFALKSRGSILRVTSSETRSVCVKQALNTRRWLVNALVTCRSRNQKISTGTIRLLRKIFWTLWIFPLKL